MALEIPAEQWNAMAARVEAAWPLAGRNCRVTGQHESGVILDGVAPPAGWRHPWTIQMDWAFDERTGRGEWRAYVSPGFVNGRDVGIAMPDPSRPGFTADRALTQWPEPYLVLDRWRIAGGSEMPGYLQQLNPLSASERFFENRETGRTPERVRALRAMDIVLVQPREGVRLVYEPGEPILGQPAAFIQAAFSSQRSEPARLTATPRIEAAGSEAAGDVTGLFGILLGNQDADVDRLKIATVWMLSPPPPPGGWPPEVVPDETWTPYPQHFVFWNLGWAARNPPRQLDPDPDPITMLLPLGVLGGGSLLQTILFTIATVRTVDQEVFAFLNRFDRRGKFWTI